MEFCEHGNLTSGLCSQCKPNPNKERIKELQKKKSEQEEALYSEDIRCGICDTQVKCKPNRKTYECYVCGKQKQNKYRWPNYDWSASWEVPRQKHHGAGLYRVQVQSELMKVIKKFRKEKWANIPESRQNEIIQGKNTSNPYEKHYEVFLLYLREGRIKAKDDSERARNFLETGVEETDDERKERELEWEIEQNLNETGFKDTNIERNEREREEQLIRERKENFSETGIEESNIERNEREFIESKWLEGREYYWIMFNEKPHDINLVGLSLCLLFPPVKETVKWVASKYGPDFYVRWSIGRMQESHRIITNRVSYNDYTSTLGNTPKYVPNRETIDFEGIPDKLQTLILELDLYFQSYNVPTWWGK